MRIAHAYSVPRYGQVMGSGERVAVRMGHGGGRMLLVPDFYRHHMQLAVPDAASRHHRIGETFDASDIAAENDHLQAVVVIHMHVHAGQRQVVMVMLHRGNAAGEIGLVVIVDVAESGDTVSLVSLVQARGLQFIAYQVAHRFRAIGVSARVYELVELLAELVIERYGEAFHGT